MRQGAAYSLTDSLTHSWAQATLEGMRICVEKLHSTTTAGAQTTTTAAAAASLPTTTKKKRARKGRNSSGRSSSGVAGGGTADADGEVGGCDYALIDGNRLPKDLPVPAEAVGTLVPPTQTEASVDGGGSVGKGGLAEAALAVS